MTLALPKPVKVQRPRTRLRRSPLRRGVPLQRTRKPIKTRRPLGTRRKEAKAAGYVDPLTWEAVCEHYRRCDGRVWCAYEPARPDCMGYATERDHVKPIAKGGEDHVRNLVPVCARCNAVKGQRTWVVPDPHPFMSGGKCCEGCC